MNKLGLLTKSKHGSTPCDQDLSFKRLFFERAVRLCRKDARLLYELSPSVCVYERTILVELPPLNHHKFHQSDFQATLGNFHFLGMVELPPPLANGQIWKKISNFSKMA